MGMTISNLFQYFFGKENARILMIGLDGAGKTTILYHLKVGEVTTTIPTIGFNVETVEYKNIKFTVWDIGGQQRIRDLWYHYYVNTSAVIFVVDSTDVERFAEAAEDMHIMLEHTELRDAVLLVCANKQDMLQAVSPTELADRFELKNVKQDWHIHGMSAKTGQGIYDSLEYLREMLAKRRKNNNRY